MIKKGFMLGLSALMLGAVALMSSCNQMNRDEVTPHPQKEKVEVSTEMYLQEPDGTLTLLSDDLRAVTGNTSLGTVEGDGTYDFNASVTLKVTAKGSYTLHKLYEKNGKGGFTESNGVVNQKSATKRFNVQDDMKFIAIFSSLSDSDLGYQKLKLDGRESDYSKTVDGDSELSESIMAVGEEVQAVKTPSGTLTGWTVRNAQYKDWEIKDKSATWLSATIFGSTGRISVIASPHISKTQGARTATFRVGKDGTSSEAPKVWRTVTITQNSYYEDDGGATSFEDRGGSSVTIPSTMNLTMPSEGGRKDLKEAHTILKNPIYAKVPVYKNGVKTSQTVRKEVTVTFGNPTHSWLTKSGDNVSAGANNTSSNRTTTVRVEFKVGGQTVKTATINISQDKKQYNVDVDLRG